MRIHFVLPQLVPYYGMEKAAVLLIKSLVNVGCQVSSTVLSGDLPPEACGIDAHLLRLPTRPTRLLAAIPRLRRALRRLPSEAEIVASGLWAAVPVGAALYGTGLNYVAWEHSFLPRRLPFDRRVDLLSRLHHKVLPPRSVVSVSDGVQRAVQAGLPRTPITTIANIVEVPAAPPVVRKCGDEVQVLTTGAFRPYKNYACAIEAMTHLPDRFSLVLAGDGVEKVALCDLTRTLGLTGRVTFLGRVSGVDELLARSHVLAHPSLSETFGFSLVEAADAGVPVATLPVTAIDELVPHLVPGTIAEDLGAAAFARAVQDAADSVTEAEALAAWELRRKRFDAETIARQWTSYLVDVSR